MNKTRLKYFKEFITYYDDWLDDLIGLNDPLDIEKYKIMEEYKFLRKNKNQEERNSIEIVYFMKFIDLIKSRES